MIGDNLKSIRTKKALTIRELSERSGVNVSTIVRIEQGEHRAYPCTIKKLADALGVSESKLTKED